MAHSPGVLLWLYIGFRLTARVFQGFSEAFISHSYLRTHCSNAARPSTVVPCHKGLFISAKAAGAPSLGPAPKWERGLHAHLNWWAVLPCLHHVTQGEDMAQGQWRKKWVRPDGVKQNSMRGLGRKEEAPEQRWSTGLYDPGSYFAQGLSPLRGTLGAVSLL